MLHTSYCPNYGGKEAVEIDRNGIYDTVEFTNLGDLQIDLYRRGLDDDEIAMVVRDVQLARTIKDGDHYEEPWTPQPQHYQWPAAPYPPQHPDERYISALKYTIAGLLLVVACFVWRGM